MSHQPGPSNDSLPPIINRVGDRIGLQYDIDRWKATQEFIQHKLSSHSEITLEQLKNTRYALDEKRTIKKGTNKTETKTKPAQNPLRLNAKKRKELYKLSRNCQLKYSTFEKINQIWLKYVLSVIKEGGDALRLFRMDLHGCKLEIEAAINPSLLGHTGIVVQETKNTFIIIKPDDKIYTLPKKDSIFSFVVENNTYRIHGSSLLLTSQNRTKAKFKQKRASDEI